MISMFAKRTMLKASELNAKRGCNTAYQLSLRYQKGDTSPAVKEAEVCQSAMTASKAKVAGRASSWRVQARSYSSSIVVHADQTRPEPQLDQAKTQAVDQPSEKPSTENGKASSDTDASYMISEEALQELFSMQSPDPTQFWRRLAM